MTNSVFCCGFECGRVAITTPSPPHFVERTSGAGASISTTTVRSGSRSLRLNPAANVDGCVVTAVDESSGIVVVRTYVYFASLPLTYAALVVNGDKVGAIFNASDSKIYAGKETALPGPPTLGASGVTITTGVWYRLDIKTVSNGFGNPWACDVQVNGTACGQATPVQAVFSSELQLGTQNLATYDIFFDDVIVTVAVSGDYPIGAGRVDHFVPTADGTHNIAGTADFKRGAAGVDILNATTDAYLLVDDIPIDDTTPDANDYINAIAPPNATDYVEVKFGPAPGISVPSVAPRAVDVIVAYHQAGTTVGASRLALNDNGTTSDIVSLNDVGVTTIRYSRRQVATPPTGGPWTVVAGAGNFNNLRMRFFSSDAAPDQYFDCAMIEAEFPTSVVVTSSLVPRLLPPRIFPRKRRM